MLTIVVPEPELFDDVNEKFIQKPGTKLELEHSLVSLSKWESKYKVPFLSEDEKTDEQTIDYIRMMCLSPEVSPEVFTKLSEENGKQVSDYIGDKQSATWFTDRPGTPRKHEVVTSEIIYYWMTAHSIPFECQYWHLNRLLTLIRVCNEKNQDPKKNKMSAREVAERQRRLNQQRRAAHKSKG